MIYKLTVVVHMADKSSMEKEAQTSMRQDLHCIFGHLPKNKKDFDASAIT